MIGSSLKAVGWARPDDRPNAARGVLAVAAAGVLAVAAPAVGATLALEVDGEQSQFQPGDTITVSLNMRNLGSNAAAGFQAFLEYDDAILTFVSATYTLEPFGLPVLTPIVPDTGPDPAVLDLAASINVPVGQPPSSAAAVLVTMIFEADVLVCVPPPIDFRPMNPPTRLTTFGGSEILPLSLQSVPPPACPEDFDGSTVVGFTDLNQLLASWGPCPGCCTDLDSDGNTGFTDLNFVLSAWGPCD